MQFCGEPGPLWEPVKAKVFTTMGPAGYGTAYDFTIGADDTSRDLTGLTSGPYTIIAWTYTGATGTQEISVDGVSVISGSPRNGVSGGDTVIAIGWTGRDANDAFNGKIDDVRIYNTVLSQQEIAGLMNPIPEPTAFGLLGLAGLMTMLRRRR